MDVFITTYLGQVQVRSSCTSNEIWSPWLGAVCWFISTRHAACPHRPWRLAQQTRPNHRELLVCISSGSSNDSQLVILMPVMHPRQISNLRPQTSRSTTYTHVAYLSQNNIIRKQTPMSLSRLATWRSRNWQWAYHYSSRIR